MEAVIDEVVNTNKQSSNSYIENIWNWMNNFISNICIYINDLISLGKEFYDYCEGDKLIKVD
jgi:hypothetical protein